MSDPDFPPGPSSSPPPQSEPPTLPRRDPRDAPEIGRSKLALAFVAGLAVAVVGCLVVYFISLWHPLSRWPQQAPDRVRVGPFEIGHINDPASTSVSVADATLSLLPITIEDQPDEQSINRLTLHIPIKARPDSHIDVRDLVIHVLFYDLVDGQMVVQTSANVNTHWVTPPADWINSDTEELAVEYDLPKPKTGATKPEPRKYYGYLVRVYYRNQLQAAAAKPERLQRQYPPPPVLSK
jgi:hypothetical protein